ncbi:hypothetical protein Q3G72_003604 [Acer saccharum]|nr:hypothetical protein Q3G72_016680 [Acer saccharum]KAK1581151.1 hypothetical protein Q3G72_003604 [Acer saccharum]
MSTSSEELELLPAIEKAVQAEVERRMKPGKKRARTLAMEQVMKPGKKRAKKRAMEHVMERVTERVMEQVMERVTEQVRVIKREMKRVIKRKMKRKCKVVKVPQGAPTDRNVYARTSEVKEYRLLFVNKLHNIIYTKDKIRDDDDGSVKIKLIDANSGEIENVGCLSSIGIEIVVLGGDFGFEGQENWTKKQFKAKIVHQRGDKPLLKGKQNITLRDGVGSIDDLSFSVNSRWIECSDLKLMYKTNPAKLRKILKGCSKWEWEVIVHHASCVLDDANSNPSRSQEAEANNTATTGSTRMQNDSNRASSSQYLAENFQNPASQPPDMSIPHSHANSQLILSNDSHQPLNSYYDDLRWYQSLFNDPLE